MEISGSYDRRGDVLYISFGRPQRARTQHGDLNALLRFDEAGTLVGITIPDVRHQAKKAKP